jgi:hypothetical protein
MHWLPWWAYPAGCCFLVGGACGWQLGYLHRGLVEWGRRAGRLLAWQRRHRGRGPLGSVLRAYRELFADIAYLCDTGQLRARKTQGGPPTVRSAAALFRPREP